MQYKFDHNLKRSLASVLLFSSLILISVTAFFQLNLIIALIVNAIVIGLSFVLAAKRLNTIKHSAVESMHRLADASAEELAELPDMPHEYPMAEGFNVLLDRLREAKKERGKISKQIRSQTFLDEETGIGNRAFFDNHLEAALSDSEITHGAVMILEIRDWDIIKTTLSNEDRSSIVKSFVEAIRFVESFSGAVLSRHSQQDFMMLIPHLSANDMDQVAKQIVNRCKSIGLPEGIDKEQFFHLGVTHFLTGQASYQVLAEADMALRAAQLQGPNTWFMYDIEEIGTDVVRGSVKWRTFLQQAIAHDSFSILFQPVIYADTRNIHHHEVLARLKDDTGKLLSANVFLPMAAKNGLITRIDQLIVSKTIRTLQYESNALCSINLDVDSVMDQTFVSWLTLTLLKHPSISKQLIFEFPEFHISTHYSQLKEFLLGIKTTGAKVAVDHVGQYVVDTEYLNHLDIDFLKLHSSVIKSVNSRSDNQLLIRALQTSISRNRAIEIFAQGVETDEEWQTLKKLNILGAQGRLFNEPLADLYP